MAIKASNLISPFSQQTLEALSKVIGDTDNGLTGSDIGHALVGCCIPDTNPNITKWKRLYNALADFSNKHQCGNHVVQFINHIMSPASYTDRPHVFSERRASINMILSLSGYTVNESGRISRDRKAETLSDAISRASRFKNKLEQRNTHKEIIQFCLAEINDENFFHAVLEAVKSLTIRIRKISGQDGDGAKLVDNVFLGSIPLVKINAFQANSQKDEQKGFASLLKGLYGMIRNPLAHEAKIDWQMTEDEAIDIIGMVSFVHRKLDNSIAERTSL